MQSHAEHCHFAVVICGCKQRSWCHATAIPAPLSFVPSSCSSYKPSPRTPHYLLCTAPYLFFFPKQKGLNRKEFRQDLKK